MGRKAVGEGVWRKSSVTTGVENGGAPPKGGGGKAPEDVVEDKKTERGGSGATVQERKSCDMIITNQVRSIL